MQRLRRRRAAVSQMEAEPSAAVRAAATRIRRRSPGPEPLAAAGTAGARTAASARRTHGTDQGRPDGLAVRDCSGRVGARHGLRSARDDRYRYARSGGGAVRSGSDAARCAHPRRCRARASPVARGRSTSPRPGGRLVAAGRRRGGRAHRGCAAGGTARRDRQRGARRAPVG